MMQTSAANKKLIVLPLGYWQDRGYTIVIVDPDKAGLRFGEFQLLRIRSNIPVRL